MECDYRNSCKKYTLGECEFLKNGRGFKNCSEYRIRDHLERMNWNSFEMMTPDEFREPDL